jgi:hypothetical protein
MRKVSAGGLEWRERYAEMLADEDDPFGVWGGEQDEDAPLAGDLSTQRIVFP